MPVIGGGPLVTGSLRRQFGDRARVGAKGEGWTIAELQRLYGRDPDTWVLHNLRLPGWKAANVDHVVLRGSTAVLLDSKCWSPGRYWTFRPGRTVRRGLRRFDVARELGVVGRLTEDLDRLLGAGVTVTPLLVIWPSRPGRISTRAVRALRLPGDLPYTLGRYVGVALERSLGPRSVPRNEYAMERLTAAAGKGAR